MTVFHDDELDDTQVALSHRRSKKIPRWAQSKYFLIFLKFLIFEISHLESQIELAIINQIYYDKKAEDIFGTIHLDLAHKMVDSIELWNTELPFIYSTLPPNFV